MTKQVIEKPISNTLIYSQMLIKIKISLINPVNTTFTMINYPFSTNHRRNRAVTFFLSL